MKEIKIKGWIGRDNSDEYMTYLYPNKPKKNVYSDGTFFWGSSHDIPNFRVKNFDLEKTDLIDVYFEYFIQYILYNYSNEYYKKYISQPFDMKITADFKSARIYMKKLKGITLHEYIYKNIINYKILYILHLQKLH